MRVRHTVPCLAVLLVATTGAARADDMFDKTRAYATDAGQPIVIGRHTRWDRHCQPVAMPPITVTQPPTHGAVTTRSGTKIASGSVGSVSCDGRSFPAVLVVYTPAAGFHGQDRLQYEATYGASPVVATVTITVR